MNTALCLGCVELGRGRAAGHPTPPAQIRTCGTTAYGSYLGCMASNRTLGKGCIRRAVGM